MDIKSTIRTIEQAKQDVNKLLEKNKELEAQAQTESNESKQLEIDDKIGNNISKIYSLFYFLKQQTAELSAQANESVYNYQKLKIKYSALNPQSSEAASIAVEMNNEKKKAAYLINYVNAQKAVIDAYLNPKSASKNKENEQ